jgi:HK97 family phage prohead protease
MESPSYRFQPRSRYSPNKKEQGMSATATKNKQNTRPPRDGLVRAIVPASDGSAGLELREQDDGSQTMLGHFAVFNQWTEINSFFEGRFMERFVKGAFTKTMKDNRQRMKVLFQHGRDALIGDKPLGPIEMLREDKEGAYYEVGLLDAEYVREQIVPGLEAGLYGASFRFRVMREEYVEEPGRSEHNPDGIPERTVKEASVPEFGPVTFPAYEGASAGVRSLTDEFLLEQLTRDPAKFREVEDFLATQLRHEAREVADPDESEVDTGGDGEGAGAEETDTGDGDGEAPDTGDGDGEDESDGSPAPSEGSAGAAPHPAAERRDINATPRRGLTSRRGRAALRRPTQRKKKGYRLP